MKKLLLILAVLIPAIAVAQIVISGGAVRLLATGTDAISLETAGAGDIQFIVDQDTDAHTMTFDSAAGLLTLPDSLDLGASGATVIVEDGTAASTCAGVVTANGTTAVTTSTTCAETGDYVFISRDSAPSGTAECYTVLANLVDGVSWELDCDGAETGTFSWWIVKGQ